MSDMLHDVSGQTSEFELKSSFPISPESKFPVSGKYQGWFVLQQPPLKTPVKVEDKEINIKFEATESDCFTLQGEGHNKFGKFTLHGTLTSDGMLQMYRSYTPKPLPSSTNKSKKSSMKSTPTHSEVVNKAKAVKPPALSVPNGSSANTPISSTREPSSRSRRVDIPTFKEDVPVQKTASAEECDILSFESSQGVLVPAT